MSLDQIGTPTARVGLPRKVRRLLDTHDRITHAPPTIERADFLHTVMCQVGMPRKKLDARTFERRSGGALLRLDAGALFDGTDMVDQPLPYGPAARLSMLYITTQAVRTKSRTISLGRSMYQYMENIGMGDGGRQYATLSTQLQALAACRITLGVSYGGRAVTLKADPFKQFEAWLPENDGRERPWPAELVLSEDYFNGICESAVPLARDALAALKGSALELDIYTWLAHRLCFMNKPTRVSWRNMKEQFGQEYREIKDFTKKFKPAMRRALCAYPEARVEDAWGGMTLYPSLPPIPRAMIGGGQ